MDNSSKRLGAAYASAASGGGIVLYGTAEALKLLARHTRTHGVIALATPPPEVIEDGALHAVRVVPGNGPVELRVVDETIEVEGGDDPRAKLAASIENLATSPAFGGVVARHIDVEYFAGHGFLAEASAWMTVTLLAAPDR